jgi:hypothetical protein
MEHQVMLYSKAFSPAPDTDLMSIQVNQHVWEEAIREHTQGRTFLKLEKEDKVWFAPMGAPVPSSQWMEESPTLFLPMWMMGSAGFNEAERDVQCTVLNQEAFPEATRIVLRVLDSAFYNSDIRGELERALSSLGVIKKHTTLQIPLEDLGGFPVEIFVSSCEPADVVLCQGEEVAVEFEEPVDQIQPPVSVSAENRPPTPIPVQPQMIIPEMGQDGFHAFQGVGNQLGSSNASIPSWRQGLPPPPRR